MAAIRSRWLMNYGRSSDPSIRLFCFHCAGGSASAFRGWPEFLPETIEVLTIQLPGREGRINEAYITTISDLTNCIVDAMTPYLDKPFAIFGHSFGTIGAFEVIRELRKRKKRQPFLFIPAGRQAPDLKDPKKPIASLPEKAFVEELNKDYGDHIGPFLQSADMLATFVPQIRADYALCESYRYRAGPPLECPIVAFAGVNEDDLDASALNAWAKHTDRDFRSMRFPGDHFFVKASEKLVVEAVSREIDSLTSKRSLAFSHRQYLADKR